MQKSAIALAVAATLAASAAAQAETTFYGSFRMGIQYTDPDGIRIEDVNSPGDVIDIFDDGFFDVTDQSSRWGVKGSEDLGNGLSAIYQLETRIRADQFNGSQPFDGRLAWVGLKGGFGAVKLGSQWSPYYNVAGRMDVFNSTWFNLYNGPFRLNNMVLYETPDSISMLKGEAAIVMDGIPNAAAQNDNFEKNIDIYNLGANFTFGPAGFGAAWQKDENADTNQWVIAASVDFAGASLAGMYEDYEVPNSDADGWNYQLLGQYAFGNNIVRAAYGQNDEDNQDKIDEWAVGFQHNLSARTRVWAEYDDLENSQSIFNVGMRHDF